MCVREVRQRERGKRQNEKILYNKYIHFFKVSFSRLQCLAAAAASLVHWTFEYEREKKTTTYTCVHGAIMKIILPTCK
jgi:hypothetical protein